MAKDGDFVNAGFTGNLTSGSALEPISREYMLGCGQNAFPGQINRSVVDAAPFRGNVLVHASVYLHLQLSASTYLHPTFALSAGCRDGKFSVPRLGHRKNQIFLLFLPVKKYGFCSRGTVVLIKSRDSRRAEFSNNHCQRPPAINVSTYLLSMRIASAYLQKIDRF